MISTTMNERSNYTVAILTASLVCTTLLIGVHQANDEKSSLVTMADEYCAGFFNTFTSTRILLLIIISFETLLQVIIF